jgi:microcystin-dependent protein
MEGVMAVVTCVAYDFAPKNWAFCNGQLLPIAQNQALFSLLGTTYGGNGVSTFGLPNLQSRTAVGTGQGPGLSGYALGEMTGRENVTLAAANVPPHVHNGNVDLYIDADMSEGSVNAPADNYPAGSGAINAYFPTVTAGSAMAAPALSNSVIQPNGGSQPFPIRMPYLGMNYVICMYGIYPTRN